jgi:hypothetical protein
VAGLVAGGCGKKKEGDDGTKAAAGGAPAAGAGQAAPPDTRTASGGEVGSLPVVADCPKSPSGTEKVNRTIPKGCGPIMTSAGDAAAGVWRGIGIYDHASRSRIDNLVLEHSGDDQGVIRVRADDIVVKGLVIRDAKLIGLRVDDGFKLDELSSTSIS